MSKLGQDKNYLTPNEVADMLMVSPVTVRQWANKGMLPALVTAGGHRRFLRRDVEKFAKDKGLVLLPQSSETLRVLIVDDNEQLSGFLVQLFSLCEEPVDTMTAYNGFEAGQKVMSFKPDVVLLDLMMPGMNGFDVCQALKNNPLTKTVRIIAMTGYYIDENVKRILQAGADDCLKKPLDVPHLLNILGLHRKHVELEPR